ncbi:hypothetical protein M2137_002236 [Parabacteroides sp. PFB2-10]|nr:hypothetical protein [Parabacteroides sp. PFB2-10]
MPYMTMKQFVLIISLLCVFYAKGQEFTIKVPDDNPILVFLE